jgi:hypothetical protein
MSPVEFVEKRLSVSALASDEEVSPVTGWMLANAYNR